MEGIKTIEPPEGEKYYELHWKGSVTRFYSRQRADEVLLLHMAKDAGRVLTPEEERMLVAQTPEAPPER